MGQGRLTQSQPARSQPHCLVPLCVSSQPMCSSEHPTKTPGTIGLSPPSSEGRSGLVHPGTDDRQAAPSAEYYYTSRSYTYEQKQQERALTYMEMRSIMNRNATTSTTTNMRSCSPESGFLQRETGSGNKKNRPPKPHRPVAPRERRNQRG